MEVLTFAKKSAFGVENSKMPGKGTDGLSNWAWERTWNGAYLFLYGSIKETDWEMKRDIKRSAN